jgi:hypothetical protein
MSYITPGSWYCDSGGIGCDDSNCKSGGIDDNGSADDAADDGIEDTDNDDGNGAGGSSY